MKKRKRIAVITSSPEEIYQQKVMKGIFDRCAEYDYDVAVITPLIHMSHYYEIYLRGEINIYNLINLDLFDGIIVVTLPMKRENDTSVTDMLYEKLRTAGCRNVVALDKPLGDYPVVHTDDRTPFREIAEHIYGFHGCRDVYFLSGPKDGDSCERLESYIGYLEENGIPYDENRIFYGDFWYTSGEKLADDIFYGRVHRPEAVICASDHMAVGLVNRLTEHGIKVPDDVIVTGFDSTAEGALNDISITSYSPKVYENAVSAVDLLHSMTEPDSGKKPSDLRGEHSLVFGDSCDCINSDAYFRHTFRQNLFVMNHNFSGDSNDIPYDFGTLTESYISEQLIRSQDEKQCLVDIVSAAYLLKPMENFTLCLREDWLTAEDACPDRYPDTMVKAAVKCLNDESRSKYGVYGDGTDTFDTALMIPEMHEEHDEPMVYYFFPVHFDLYNFGYAVLSKKLSSSCVINNVPKQWLRYVNTALEMTKIRTKIYRNTITDVTTGLLNRHGMYCALADYIRSVEAENSYLAGEGRPQRKPLLLVIMIDMDGLKRINDTYGHREGDFGISLIAGALGSVRFSDDIAVRNGGDEFLFVSMGDFSAEEAEQRAAEKIAAMEKYISEKSAASGKPYPVSASFGYAAAPLGDASVLDELISTADERMYENKKKKKAERRD